MDRTYLLNRSREEQARADAATSKEARLAHQALARCFKEAAEREATPAAVRHVQQRLDATAPARSQQPQ